MNKPLKIVTGAAAGAAGAIIVQKLMSAQESPIEITDGSVLLRFVRPVCRPRPNYIIVAKWPLRVRSLDLLQPGRPQGDVVVRSIPLWGRDWVLTAHSGGLEICPDEHWWCAQVKIKGPAGTQFVPHPSRANTWVFDPPGGAAWFPAELRFYDGTEPPSGCTGWDRARTVLIIRREDARSVRITMAGSPAGLAPRDKLQ
jgi:hypothetical protein